LQAHICKYIFRSRFGYYTLPTVTNHTEKMQQVDYGTLERKAEEGRGQSGRWGVVAAVSLNSALNASLCMTFSAVSSTASEVLEISEKEVAGLYTVWLMTVLLGLTPAMIFVDRYERSVFYLSVLFNVGTAWERYLGLLSSRHAYMASRFSQILCGIGAWPIFCLPGQVSHNRFPVHERPLATSIISQANFFGWLVGLSFPPLLVSDEASLKMMTLIFACVASVVGIAAVLSYHPPRALADGEGTSSHHAVASPDQGFKQFFQAAHQHPLLGVQILAHGILGGIGFATPAISILILDSNGLSGGDLVAAVNAAFIGTGVLCGVLLGWYCKDQARFGAVLKTCYFACTMALLGCALQAHFGMIGGSAWSTVLLLFLNAIAGAASLGYIGIAIEAASLYPVKAGYVCWAIEFLIFIFASVLSYAAASKFGFNVLTSFSALCTLLIVCLYEQPS